MGPYSQIDGIRSFANDAYVATFYMQMSRMGQYGHIDTQTSFANDACGYQLQIIYILVVNIP